MFVLAAQIVIFPATITLQDCSNFITHSISWLVDVGFRCLSKFIAWIIPARNVFVENI